jgi:hypothetical protein
MLERKDQQGWYWMRMRRRLRREVEFLRYAPLDYQSVYEAKRQLGRFMWRGYRVMQAVASESGHFGQRMVTLILQRRKPWRIRQRLRRDQRF